MTGLAGVDPTVLRAAMVRIRDETGVDLFDRAADQAAAAAAMKRGARQSMGAIAGGIVGGAALLCLILAVVPGGAGVGLRVSFAVLAALLAFGAAEIFLHTMRPTDSYRAQYLARKAAWQRLHVELGLPDPYGAGTWRRPSAGPGVG